MVAAAVTVKVTSGTVLLTRPESTLSEAVVETIENLPEGIRLETDPDSQATIEFKTPGDRMPLGTLQVYGNSDATLLSMRSPRFATSENAHRIQVWLQRGRIRVSVAVGIDRPIVIILETPHTTIQLVQPGSYSIEVRDTDSQVAVRDGAATVTAQGRTLILAANERTFVRDGEEPAGVLPSERNLVQNGDFETSLSDGWTTFLNRQEVDEAPGEIEVTVHDGRRAVHLNRRGSNWAEVGIRQTINRDVLDVASLQLHLAVWLAFQDLRNCGSLGSECPLIVRIEFTDTAGNAHEWLQGFYYLSAIGNGTPVRCVTCSAPTGDHLQISNGVWFSFDTPELTELFATTGNPPATINAITIYASGHNFESFISEVELLAQD